MKDRSSRIFKLLQNQKFRAAYIQAKLGVLVPSQIRSLRLKSSNPPMPRQQDLAEETGMQQSRISMFETPGAANVTLETLANIAAGLRVGLIVKFVPFSEMLRWENSYAPDTFDVIPRLEKDEAFLFPDRVLSASAPDRAEMGKDGKPDHFRDAEEMVAPDRAEELARDKFAELRSFLTNMRRDAADAEDPELSEYAQAIEQRLDELASLLRDEMAAAPPREGG